MKNVFIWVAKFILAVLVIIGVSYLLTGAEYLILSIFDYVSKTNYLSDFDSWDGFKYFFIVSCIVLAISKQMDDIKFSFKTKKSKLKNIKQYSNMNELEYLNNCKRTLSTKDDLLEHMIIGCVTEVGELADAYKKHKFYKRDLNTQNIKEEIGDLCWYIYQLCEEVGYTMEEARKDNIIKLAKRYPDKFEDVIIRDVNIELNHIK